MKVGQTLLLYKNKDTEFVKHKITKIGRKYIYCKTDDKYEHEIILNKTTMLSCSGYNNKFYASERAYKDEVESIKLCKSIVEFFRIETHTYAKKLSLSILIKIRKLIDDETQNRGTNGGVAS